MNNIDLPLVSIILATYKRENFIKDAILNIKEQTYSNIELIIIDDNGLGTTSQELTFAKIKNFLNNKTLYFALDKNRGSCYARNYGTNKARGNYLSFFDDDDQWHPKKIELQLKKFIDNPYLGFAYCDEKKYFLKNHKLISTNVINYGEGYIFEKYLNLSSGIIHTPNPLILRKAFESVGGFDPEQQSGTDFDLFVRITKIYPVGKVNEFLHFIYIHQQNRITTNHWSKIKGKKRLLEKYGDLFNSNRKLKLYQGIIAHSFWIRNIDSAVEAKFNYEKIKKLPVKYKCFIFGINNFILRWLIILYFRIFIKNYN